MKASLADTLRQHHSQVTDRLVIGYARCDDLIDRVERRERAASKGLEDEQIWTFLVGCGYAIAGKQGVTRLTEILTGSSQREPNDPRIWFEVLPIPPRHGEGATHLDLALGTIQLREGTESGVQLASSGSRWICFCEMKWGSDISTRVTYDPHRNQMIRVIENALCFQGGGKYADTIYVILVTPSVFRNAAIRSRLYQYKFDEYRSDLASLVDGLNACALSQRTQPDWSYPPDLAQRAASLSLRWVTYDELFENVPDSAIAGELTNFWAQHGEYQGQTNIL